MRLLKFKSTVSANLKHLPGWKTNRKIIVIESDDWGSVRMPGKAVYNRLLKDGYKVDADPYYKYDALASETDLCFLFEALNKFRDHKNNPPVITANVILANPDFEAIKNAAFQEYHYQLFTETLLSYPEHSKSFSLWQEGMQKKLFHPQLHGREHLNVIKWMKALKAGNPDLIMAFNHKMLSMPLIDNMNAFLDAFEFDSPQEITVHGEIIKDAAGIFNDIFGFKSKSIIAPCYIWSKEHEAYFNDNSIEYLQGFSYQYEPLPIAGTLKYKKRFHYTGQQNRLKQLFLVRTCFFEPTLSGNTDVVGECLRKIQAAFRWCKPAIIGSHRLNFIGYIDPTNRDKNLKLLHQLISAILSKWPDAEFMTSDQLGDLIKYGETKDTVL
jgi:hypothetical protein